MTRQRAHMRGLPSCQSSSTNIASQAVAGNAVVSSLTKGSTLSFLLSVGYADREAGRRQRSGVIPNPAVQGHCAGPRIFLLQCLRSCNLTGLASTRRKTEGMRDKS